MRKKVHQVKEEILQEVSKENGKDNNKICSKILQTGRSGAAARSSMQRLPKVV